MRIPSVAFLSLCLALSPAIVRAENPVVPASLQKTEAKQLVISGKEQIAPYKLARFTVENVPPGYFILWDVYPMENVDAATQKTKGVYEFTAPPGVYKVRVRAFKGENDQLEAWSSVTIGKAPTPPGPDVDPNPPGPTPNPAPKGFRVIFVYETGDIITSAMQQVMFGEKVRTYLDAKTVKGEKGTMGWRRFDKDINITGEKDENIKALWNSARPAVTTLPAIIVAVDGKADIVPFPANEDDALTLFKKYGGN